MKPSLLQQLITQENIVFGLDNHPISTNIKSYLIPIAEELLNRIPAYMPEYTLHNIKHCDAILKTINDILPETTELNIVELTILIYSVYLHDIGMVVNQTDAEKFKSTSDFKKLLMEFDKEATENEILTEFIRRNHVYNSLNYIDKFMSNFNVYKISFDFMGLDLSHWVKKVILSHAYPINFIKNSIDYPIDTLIDTYQVDIQFLSMLLRLGDILDFDIFRTPPFLYQHINPKNHISIKEWEKHQAITGKSINENKIRFGAFCKSAEIERLVREFTKWIERERSETMALLNATNERSNKLNLNDSLSLDCRNDSSYIYTDLQLQLDYEKVLNILMGTELYDSPDIFLREIIQNSYDACKCRLDQLKKIGDAYVPAITINYSTENRILRIEDNGIGIDEDVFKNYVINIGRSYYKSKIFQVQQYGFTPISNFGIGIISCFMVSDSIEMESLKYYSPSETANPIHYILNIDRKFIDERKGSKVKYGTVITLKLKKDYIESLNEKSISDIIKENMNCFEIPIYLTVDGKREILDEKKITAPDEYKSVNNILVLELKEEEWIEGYIVIHQNLHYQVVEQSKISQQCFTITNKNGGFPLTIPWLAPTKFFFDIKPPKKINLKANRNKVQEDSSFKFLRDFIIEYIITQFEKEEYSNKFLHYVHDARGNVLSGNEKEYQFLLEKIPISYLVMNANQIVSKQGDLKKVIKAMKGAKIAIIHRDIFSAKSANNMMFLFKKYKYVLLDDQFTQYFYQFSSPYISYQDLIVTDISGVVYFEIGFKNEFTLNIKDYNLKYSWFRDYEISYHSNKTQLFCIVGNNQYNSVDLKMNNNHRLVKLLNSANKTIPAKSFLGSFKTNVTLALENNLKLAAFINYGGEHHTFTNNSEAYSLKTIGFMMKSFIKSFNETMVSSLLIPLAKDRIISNDDINNYLFTENDFPNWWFMD